MSPQAAVRLRRVSKRFRLSHEKPALVRDLLPRLMQPIRWEWLWALRDIDLEVVQGGAVGIIGPNGAGKSTVLSLIAGITQPTNGAVEVRGRVAPLLTLGSGFHPELTGLENVFLNGTLLGMTTREVRKHLEAIVAFSQLDGFIDAPLHAYSAGMQMRLGFAIAVHAACDILVVDETISVGDTAFQAQCLERLLALKREGTTLIMAAQNAEALEPIADRALLLHQGRVIAEGTVDHVRERYAVLTSWLSPVAEPLSAVARLLFQEQAARHQPALIRRGWGERYGTGEAEIEEVCLVDSAGRIVTRVESGAAMTVVVRFTVEHPLKDPHVGVAFFCEDGTYCYGPNTRMDGLQWLTIERGAYECRLAIDALRLTAGAYRLSVAIWDPMERSPYAYHIGGYPLHVTGASTEGVVILDHQFRFAELIDAGEQTPRLMVEGPRGEQAWYRSFEPLTLTAMLPLPPPTGAPTLRAECRGPNGELWWVSRWPAPSPKSSMRDGGPQGAAPRYQLHFPELALLTGQYQWSVGWETAQASLVPSACVSRVIEVMADRLDHGVVRLPHRWQLMTHSREPRQEPVSQEVA